MSNFGSGQWADWTSYPWGAPFLWTTLHTFGGNDAIHGNLSRVNRIPFDALGPPQQVPGVVPAIGLGITPEGFDQDPAVRKSDPFLEMFNVMHCCFTVLSVLRSSARGCISVSSAP